MTTTLKFCLVFLLLFTSRVETFGFLMQGLDSPDGGGDPYPEVDPAPIGDHLYLLLFTGLLLGAYFVMKRKRISTSKI